MGDTIAFTTWPKHQNLFYKIDTNAITFEVKANGNAVVGLSKNPSMRCEFTVCIGDNNHCWIKHYDEHSRSVEVQNVLSNSEYRRFWITWTDGAISLGHGHGDSKLIMNYVHNKLDIKYITFGVLKERNPVDWRLELPPVIETPKVRPISGGKLQWLLAEDQLPEGALLGGFEKEVLYIIRARHRNSLTPGKFVPYQGTAYIPWGGDSNEKAEFEVLVGYDCMWQKTSGNKIPVQAFPGGYSETNRETLFIGRAEHEGHVIPGKVQPTHSVCYIAYEGKEIAKKNYEILIDPTIDVKSVNRHYISVDIDSASDSDSGDDWVDHNSWMDDDYGPAENSEDE